MNVLLFAPGLLWLLWEEASRKRLSTLISYLTICALVQLLLGLPFLIQFPIPYLHHAFDLTRVFDYQWTVNWAFLPERIFVSKEWAICLLVMHLSTLILLWKRLWVRNKSLPISEELYKTYITFVFFTSNFSGIIFARSLHYQFYSWYFPSVPFLLCHLAWPGWIKVLFLFMLECCWNVYPPRWLMSLVLLILHLVFLVSIFTSPLKDYWRKEFIRTTSRIGVTRFLQHRGPFKKKSI